MHGIHPFLIASVLAGLLAGCGPAVPFAERVKQAAARIPEGSADYSESLALAMAYKAGDIDFDELKRRVLEKKLEPHPLGDSYLLMVPPPPPDGVKFDPMLMPSDWKGNWGEVAMMMFAGDITEDEYEELHAAAHPDCKKK